MERLKGKKVSNDQLGEGIIRDAQKTDNGIIITVDFPNKTGRYGFPIAIDKGTLKSVDEDLQDIAEDIAIQIEAERKKAEEAANAAEKERLRKISDDMLEEAKVIIGGIDRDQKFDQKRVRIFKVHQGKTYEPEHLGGYVWAPADGSHHHRKLLAIQPGDIIFHYLDKNNGIVAVSEALSGCFSYPCPAELAGNGWGHSGYRVEVRYQVLDPSYPLQNVLNNIKKNKSGKYSSFDHNGDAIQGYMFELEYVLAQIFKTGILATNQPAGVKNVLNRI